MVPQCPGPDLSSTDRLNMDNGLIDGVGAFSRSLPAHRVL